MSEPRPARDVIAAKMADAAERQCKEWDRKGAPPWMGKCDFDVIADAILADYVLVPKRQTAPLRWSFGGRFGWLS